jgi:hypothetical protein
MVASTDCCALLVSTAGALGVMPTPTTAGGVQPASIPAITSKISNL